MLHRQLMSSILRVINLCSLHCCSSFTSLTSHVVAVFSCKVESQSRSQFVLLPVNLERQVELSVIGDYFSDKEGLIISMDWNHQQSIKSMNIIKLLCASIVTFAFRCRRIGLLTLILITSLYTRRWSVQVETIFGRHGNSFCFLLSKSASATAHLAHKPSQVRQTHMRREEMSLVGEKLMMVYYLREWLFPNWVVMHWSELVF